MIFGGDCSITAGVHTLSCPPIAVAITATPLPGPLTSTKPPELVDSIACVFVTEFVIGLLIATLIRSIHAANPWYTISKLLLLTPVGTFGTQNDFVSVLSPPEVGKKYVSKLPFSINHSWPVAPSCSL